MTFLASLMQVGFTPAKAKALGEDVSLAITATGNNSQANAYQIATSIIEFSTVTSSANSAKLPQALSWLKGTVIIANSDSSNTLYVFPYSGDSINSLSADVAVMVLPGQAVTFYALSTTRWLSPETSSLSVASLRPRVLANYSTLTYNASDIETSFFTYTFTGGDIGSSGGFRFTAFGRFWNNNTAAFTPSLRAYFGGTQMFLASPALAASAQNYLWRFDCYLQNGAANSQHSYCSLWISAATAGNADGSASTTFNTTASSVGENINLAEDTTADQEFELTIDHSSNNANYFTIFSKGVLELI